MKRFIDDAARAGVDGLLVLDLPPEESAEYDALMREAGPVPDLPGGADHPGGRAWRASCSTARGFIYYVSREGVTGMQASAAGHHRRR